MKKHIPNFITCLNLFSGCLAVTSAFNGDYLTASVFIGASAIFDFLDGFMARLLKAYSDIGKELDSLADCISFGLAPAMIVSSMFKDYQYEESLFFIAPYLPYFAFLIAVFSALRLAKFNVDDRQHTSFIGMPTPANALLIVGLANASSLQFLWTTPVYGLIFLICFTLISSYLLVSELPMFSLKGKSKLPIIFLVVSVILVLILGFTGLFITMILYILLSATLAIVNRNKA